MRIAVIGTGGIGGPYGASLAKAGADVIFVARGAHLRAIREKIDIECRRDPATELIESGASRSRHAKVTGKFVIATGCRQVRLV